MSTSTLTPPAGGRVAAIRQWLLVPANQLFILLLLLAGFLLLWELGRTPMQLWDESRLAVGAVEMAKGGNWLVVTYEGQPDHWSTKPPFFIWCQVALIKLIGYNVWATRLPSTIAAFGTLVLLYRFAAFTLRRPLAGFFGGLVLVTASGYLRLHGARTGDYDVMLAFWETIIWISFFHYLENGRARHLYWLGAALTLAMLTKGIAGLLGGPALLLYALVRGRLGWLVRQPLPYVVVAASLAVMAAYYFGREAYDPGYLAAVRENEWGSRMTHVVEGHTGEWSFYFDRLYAKDFSEWLWWLLLAPLVWVQPDQLVRRGGALLLIFVLGWLLVLSPSATKIDWYAIPTYPPLALLIGMGISILYTDVLAIYLPRLGPYWRWPIRVGLVILLFYLPYRAIVRQIIAERTSDFDLHFDGYMARYVHQLVREQPGLDTVQLLSTGGYNSSLLFYHLAIKEENHREVALRNQTEIPWLQPGSKVLVCDPLYKSRIDSTFQYLTLYQDFPCETRLLLRHK